MSHNCENIVQGGCADLLGMALVRHEQLGFNPVLHVHDEDGCETDDKNQAEYTKAMSEPPSWAPDLPILAESYSGPLWTKNAEGYAEMHGLMGKIVKHVPRKL